MTAQPPSQHSDAPRRFIGVLKGYEPAPLSGTGMPHENANAVSVRVEAENADLKREIDANARIARDLNLKAE